MLEFGAHCRICQATVVCRAKEGFSNVSGIASHNSAKAAAATTDTTATNALLTANKNARNSVSQVNLDEEAGDMIKFQQYYTASSQIIKAAQETFSTLINSL